MNRTKKRRQRASRVHRKIAHFARGAIRLSVYKSDCHIYAQAIDDAKAQTIASASSVEAEFRGVFKGGTVDAATKIGTRIAERLKEKSVERVVFDRGGFPYQGRVKHLAEALRKAGIKV